MTMLRRSLSHLTVGALTDNADYPGNDESWRLLPTAIHTHSEHIEHQFPKARPGEDYVFNINPVG